MRIRPEVREVIPVGDLTLNMSPLILHISLPTRVHPEVPRVINGTIKVMVLLIEPCDLSTNGMTYSTVLAGIIRNRYTPITTTVIFLKKQHPILRVRAMFPV